MAGADHIKPMPQLLPETWRRFRKRLAIAAVVGAVLLVVSWTVPAVRDWRFISSLRLWMMVPSIVLAFNLSTMRADRLERFRKAAPTARELIRQAPATLGQLLLFAVLISVVAYGRSPLRLDTILWLPIIIGAAMWVFVQVYASTRRTGTEQFCAGCGYRFGFASQAEAPECCSECGRKWADTMITGRPRIAWGWMALSVPIFGGMMAGMFWWMSAFPKLAARVLPQQVLLREPNDSSIWFQLNDMQVDPALVPATVDRLIAERQATRSWGYANNWLSKQYLAGSISDAQRAEILALNMSSLSTVIDETTAAGIGLTLRVRVLTDDVKLSGHDEISVAGFRVDDGAWTWLKMQPVSTVGMRDYMNIAAKSRLLVTLPGAIEGYAGRRITLRVHHTFRNYAPDRRPPTWSDDGMINFPRPPEYVRTYDLTVDVPANRAP